MKLKSLVSKHYNFLLVYALSARAGLLIPLIVFAMLYGNFLNIAQNPTTFVEGQHAFYTFKLWGLMWWGGVICYICSILFDIVIVRSDPKQVNYTLATVVRLFRILTYFYVGATAANFAYRSYMTVGFNLPLHALLFLTMVLLVVLILLHAYQCREGLIFGGAYSEESKC